MQKGPQGCQAPTGRLNYSYENLMEEHLGPGAFYDLPPSQHSGDQLLRGWPQTQLLCLAKAKEHETLGRNDSLQGLVLSSQHTSRGTYSSNLSSWPKPIISHVQPSTQPTEQPPLR